MHVLWCLFLTRNHITVSIKWNSCLALKECSTSSKLPLKYRSHLSGKWHCDFLESFCTLKQDSSYRVFHSSRAYCSLKLTKLNYIVTCMTCDDIVLKWQRQLMCSSIVNNWYLRETQLIVSKGLSSLWCSFSLVLKIWSAMRMTLYSNFDEITIIGYSLRLMCLASWLCTLNTVSPMPFWCTGTMIRWWSW